MFGLKLSTLWHVVRAHPGGGSTATGGVGGRGWVAGVDIGRRPAMVVRAQTLAFARAWRAAIKRQRDGAQAHAVARMLAYAWEAVDLSDEALMAIPMGLRTALRQAIEGAEAPKSEW